MAQIKITLVKSTIGTKPNQRKNIEALGLKKTQSYVLKEDNSAIRGMLDKVRHLVRIENV